MNEVVRYEIVGNGGQTVVSGVPNGNWVQYDDYATLRRQAEALARVLAEQLGPSHDLTHAPCHVGITTADKCGRCQRETRARAALADFHPSSAAT